MHPSGISVRRRVLVIDDDPMAIDILSLILRGGGFQVSAATSAIGVTQLVADTRPDAIVMDLNMPAMSGDRLARLLRRNPRSRKIPLVLVSGDGFAALQEAAQGIEDVHLMEKEDARRDLVALVRRAIRMTDATGRTWAQGH